MEKGYLVLQDGQVFEGLRFGAGGDTVGELVFTTGMCGYIETLTDPSYAGQIVLQTYPLIGNYGIIREDFEGACCVKGYVVREYCDAPSNFRCDCDLDAYLKEQNVPGLCGVDTRELTRIIREHGVMNAAICSGIPADLTPVKTYAVTGVVEAVTCRESSIHPASGEERFRVSLLDGTRTYITSQNHGYAVDSDTVKLGRVRFANANDGTCEGIDYPDLRAFTVQFHPEACTGPKDTSFLFDRFVDLMKGGRA